MHFLSSSTLAETSSRCIIQFRVRNTWANVGGRAKINRSPTLNAIATVQRLPHPPPPSRCLFESRAVCSEVYQRDIRVVTRGWQSGVRRLLSHPRRTFFSFFSPPLQTHRSGLSRWPRCSVASPPKAYKTRRRVYMLRCIIDAVKPGLVGDKP